MDVPTHIQAILLSPEEQEKRYPDAPKPGTRFKDRETGQKAVFIGVAINGDYVIKQFCDQHGFECDKGTVH